MQQYTEDELATYEEKQSSGGGGGGGGGCFPAGTVIATPSGETPIERLVTGQVVLGYNTRMGNVCPRRIHKVLRHDRNRLWLLRLADGSQVRTTAIHSFRVGCSWKQARHIGSGDHLQSALSDNPIPIVESKRLDEVCDVYNLIVDGEYTFIADGIVAHSFTHCRSLRMVYWKARSRLEGIRTPALQWNIAKLRKEPV